MGAEERTILGRLERAVEAGDLSSPHDKTGAFTPTYVPRYNYMKIPSNYTFSTLCVRKAGWFALQVEQCHARKEIY
jgi:hypothetical protein